MIEKIFIKFKNNKIFVFSILFNFLLFLPLLKVGFFSDDYHFLFIAQNTTKVFDYFFTNYTGQIGPGSYTPLFNLVLQFQFWLFSKQAIFYHLINWLLVISTSIVLFKLTKLFKLSKKASNITIIFFLFSHLLVVSLAWFAVQPHLWADLFLLLSLYYFLKPNSFGFSLVFLILSLGFKENALLLPFIWFLVFIGLNKKPKYIDLIFKFLSGLTVVIIYLFIRSQIIKTLVGFYAQRQFNFGQIKEMFKMLIEIIVNIFFAYPFRLNISHYLTGHKIFLGVLLLIILFSFLKIKNRLLFFLLLSASLINIPFYLVKFNYLTNIGERYSYLWLIFSSLIVGLLFHNLKTKISRFVFGLILVLVLGHNLFLIKQKITYWQTAAKIRQQILNSSINYQIDDYYLFIALPDNYFGVPLLANAIKEMLFIEGKAPYIQGQRILMASLLGTRVKNYQDNFIEILVKNNYNLKIKPTTKTNLNIFTGLPQIINETGEYKLNNFNVLEQSGSDIDINLKPSFINELRGNLHIIYYNHNHLNDLLIK